MQLLHSKESHVLVITPVGVSLDAKDAPEFKETVMHLIDNTQVSCVVFDLHELQYIDSTGLGTFLTVLKRLNNTGGELKLACLNKPIRVMIELISMHKVFEIYNNTQDAVRSFNIKL